MMYSLWVRSHLPIVEGVITEGAPAVGDMAAGAHETHNIGVQAQPPLQIHLSPAITQGTPSGSLKKKPT